MAVRKVGVAICGLGTIGRAVVKLLTERSTLLRSTYGVEFDIRAVLERGPERAERAGLDGDVVETDWQKIIERGDIDLVVELLGGEDPASSIITQTLAAGKHVVTANKEAVSKNYSDMLNAAHRSDRALMFEASVGGGIPIMTSVRQALISNQITRVRGILNGTTNFILSQMTTEGTPYDEALAQAQELGYAEPDPTADVEGWDATYKIAILASMISGQHVHPDQVDRTGITGVTPEAIGAATEAGQVIKLIAEASVENGTVAARVAPIELDQNEPLSSVHANLNALQLDGSAVGPVTLIGQGAGPSPTASVIVGDLVEAIRTGAAANPPKF